MRDVTEDILMRLKEAGHKFTGKRRDMVEIFVANQETYLTAKDLLEQMKASYPSISFDTVYRTIALLQELGIIECMEFSDTASKYRLTCQAQHHHHLICLACGHITTIDDCPMASLESALSNFTVTHHRFEVYGYCAACATDR